MGQKLDITNTFGTIVNLNNCMVYAYMYVDTCSRMSMHPIYVLQGMKKNKDCFTPEVIEAYKYVYSQPGAVTAPLNYYRCIFKNSKMKMGAKRIEVPILIIWVSSRESWT